MSLEKEHQVEIGGKDYTLEMTNLALVEFEKLTGKSYLEWIQKYVLDSEGDIKWQPPIGDFLRLVLCQLKEHQPKLRFTVPTLSKHLGPKDIIGELGLAVMNCLVACLVDEKDVGEIKSDSAEAGEADPLAEQPPGGGT